VYVPPGECDSPSSIYHAVQILRCGEEEEEEEEEELSDDKKGPTTEVMNILDMN